MIHISKMGNNLSPEDSDIENKYKITGDIYRITKNTDNKTEFNLFTSSEELQHLSFMIDNELEVLSRDNLEKLKDTKPEDIKF